MKQYRSFQAVVSVLALLAISIVCSGCARHAQQVRGAAPISGPFVTVSAVSAHKVIRLKGVMVEKCPIAGCWFMLRDKTGQIKIDTKNAGFVVSDVPLNTVITVQGKMAVPGESTVAASGISF